MIGVTLKEKKRGGRDFVVVGEYEAGYIIAPVEFDGTPNEHVTASDLAARFGTDAPEAKPVDEVEGWKVLGERFGDAVDAQLRGDIAPPAKTPEQTFGEIVRVGPDARRVGVKS